VPVKGKPRPFGHWTEKLKFLKFKCHFGSHWHSGAPGPFKKVGRVESGHGPNFEIQADS
jgi:hypothetical protein